MMKLVTILFAVILVEKEVSCEFKCVTDQCMTQEELPKKFGRYFTFRKQENEPCLKFSSPTNLVRPSHPNPNQIFISRFRVVLLQFCRWSSKQVYHI